MSIRSLFFYGIGKCWRASSVLLPTVLCPFCVELCLLFLTIIFLYSFLWPNWYLIVSSSLTFLMTFPCTTKRLLGARFPPFGLSRTKTFSSFLSTTDLLNLFIFLISVCFPHCSDLLRIFLVWFLSINFKFAVTFGGLRVCVLWILPNQWDIQWIYL